MQNIPGFISAFNLETWWTTRLTPKERETFVDVLLDYDPEVLHPNYAGSPDSVDSEGNQVSRLSTELDRIVNGPFTRAIYAPIRVKILQLYLLVLEEEGDIFRKHLALTWLGDAYYKMRDIPLMIEHAVEAYEKCLGMSTEVAQNLPWDGPLPSHNAAKRLSIIYADWGDYPAALRVNFKMKLEGWNGDWDKRISRIAKKGQFSDEELALIEMGVDVSRPILEHKHIDIPPTVSYHHELLVQRSGISITIDMRNQCFEVNASGTRKTASFPPHESSGSAVTWQEFLNVVASLTAREGHQVEGSDQWWLLETDPLDLEHAYGADIPPHTLTLLKGNPYGIVFPEDPFPRRFREEARNLNLKSLYSKPSTTDNFSAYLYTYADHRSKRDSCGFISPTGEESWGSRVELGGSYGNQNLDLYSELRWTIEQGLKEGLTPTGPWIGRIITGPLDGMFRATFYASAEFKPPGFKQPLWR